MRTHGTLARWNEDRGFGFIVPAEGRTQIFVHISAFPRDGAPPRVGEVITYVVETGADGKQRAGQVLRPGNRTATRRVDRAISSPRGRKPVPALISLLLVGAIGFYAYTSVTRKATAPQGHYAPAAATAVPERQFRCDGRTYCSQMTSCAEATYFVQHCPDTKMDGNGDGVPCEQQWCR
ncbi:MAG: excalibur calcium-binding domain-containing protein [Pseudoxanthomonas sp.]